MECRIIAHIETDFDTKFGVPRQAGLIPELEGRIVFEPPYRVADALRGLEGYSHLWIIWEFSGVTEQRRQQAAVIAEQGTSCTISSPTDDWTPTVRPPRLGGNKRMGVFATRSPFRPNPIGLSSVEISRIDLNTPNGPIIYVKGADLMNGTPILDIKPYLPFTDAHPEARGGFTDQTRQQEPLEVVIPDKLYTLYNNISAAQWTALHKVLSEDPRPHYQHDDDRLYGITFAGIDFHFRVKGQVLYLVAP